MAYIAPNSVIKLAKGIPLDSKYNDTVLYADKNAQLADFESYVKYTFQAYSYQRVKNNTIRISMVADNLYDCNYMLFQNSNYGNKWFFAFVDKITYINNATSEIEYHLDLMQTFFFDYDIPPCFVEREHALTDLIGDNMIPEPVGGGEMTVKQRWLFNFTDFYVVIKYVPNEKVLYKFSYDNVNQKWIIRDKPKDDAYGFYQYEMYSGYCCLPIARTINNIQLTQEEYFNVINLALSRLVEIQATIVDVIIYPVQLYDYAHSKNNMLLIDPTLFPAQHVRPFIATPVIVTRQQNKAFWDETHTYSYTPKNRKLYTRPYSQLLVSNNAGKTATYGWEQFGGFGIDDMKFCTFKVEGSCDPIPVMVMYPFNYRGFGEFGDDESGIIFDNFVHCTWSEDSYQKWITTNREVYGASMISSLLSMLTNLGQRATHEIPIQAAIDAGGTAVNMLSYMAEQIAISDMHKHTPDQMYSQSIANGIQYWQRRIGYYMYDMGLELDLARSVDDFFTKYGYAQNKIKIPDIKDINRTLPLRPYWNYIKTGGCLIIPKQYDPPILTNIGMTSDDKTKIENIYDNGITFWNNLANVGKYNLDNSIIEGD